MAELTPVAWLELLDGLRGIAALLAVLFYFASTHLTSLITDQHTSPSLVADTPVAILYNGRFAAILFFVLSDMVVSNSAAKTRGAKPQDCGAAACKMTKAAGGTLGATSEPIEQVDFTQ